ncbi:MAG: ribbon-helix-helix domain-containing protein [Spirochaetaceae bacterium]|jgi:hypothetical protein|nr:ribbon-helix-helix domain-containing protein [Spirochaetaceae bacterium]
MTTVRLPPTLEHKLRTVSEVTQRPQSTVVKDALEIFFSIEERAADSFQTGKRYFGKYGSGDGALSVNYKALLKEKLHAKQRAH